MEREYSLPHHQRLRSRGSIRRLFDSGKSGFVYPLRYIWFAEDSPEGEANQAEVLFTVPKRFHKRANRRNLLRRYIKESYRLQKSIILDRELLTEDRAKSIDIAIIYSTKEQKSYKNINNAVRKILENIAKDL
ncbi:MAG: ribonuclease P protein component [Rikenellaceae bacterium]